MALLRAGASPPHFRSSVHDQDDWCSSEVWTIAFASRRAFYAPCLFSVDLACFRPSGSLSWPSRLMTRSAARPTQAARRQTDSLCKIDPPRARDGSRVFLSPYVESIRKQLRIASIPSIQPFQLSMNRSAAKRSLNRHSQT